ncbi:hypothetical protein [Pseudomonas aeruginosa]
MPFQHVLRRHDHGDAQQRVLGHSIEQGVEAIAFERLAGELGAGGSMGSSFGSYGPRSLYNIKWNGKVSGFLDLIAARARCRCAGVYRVDLDSRGLHGVS